MAYGSMYENNGSGSTISNTSSFKGWVTATAGQTDVNGFVAFESNATADRLNINQDGDYYVTFSTSFTNDGGNVTTASVFIDGVETDLSSSRQGDSGEIRTMGNSFILSLSSGEYIDLRFESTSSDDVDIYQTSVSAIRVSDD
ncbi:MAG: hypothetical protein GY928_01895 [Colwellia sp.]|nr:hypothetical protein [Colwellia sp.]